MTDLREHINLDDKDPSELERLRRDLTTKALELQKTAEELNDDDLHLLCAVTQSLRRRSVTPKAKAAKAAKTKPSLDSI